MTDTDFDPPVGIAETLSPGLRRVLAPNPSPMTYRGTNTYLLGTGVLAVIDPGPDDPQHNAALLGTIGGALVSHIFVTHSHIDHSPGARALSKATGAPVVAFGDSRAGQSDVMRALAAAGMAGGGEGVDQAFAPDFLVRDCQVIAGDGWEIEVLHTPGHMGNHISLRWGKQIFCGDLVMGWASSLVSPPDGDLTDFLSSCERLRSRAPEILQSGHGAPITDPVARLDWLIAHRHERTLQIMNALDDGPRTTDQLTAAIYHDIPPAMHPVAARNVFAHLVHLTQSGRVVAMPNISIDAQFRSS